MTSLNQRLISLESNAGTTSGTTGTIAIADVENLQTTLDAKQNTLTAGTNISIVDNVISSSGSSGGTITIADVDNLQTSLDNKQNSITITTDLSCNLLNTIGNLSIGGIISAPNQISFRASRTGAGVVNSNIILPFNAVITNIGNAYNVSSYHFTAPVNGTYYFFTSFFTNGDNTYTVDILKLSGSTESVLYRLERPNAQAGGTRDISASICAFINSGDKIYVKKVGNSSIFLPDNPYCFFGGCLL